MPAPVVPVIRINLVACQRLASLASGLRASSSMAVAPFLQILIVDFDLARRLKRYTHIAKTLGGAFRRAALQGVALRHMATT
jgi:hypothetical protein